MRNESIDNGWGPSENEANQRPFGEMSSSLRGCWQPCMPDDDGESVTIDREIRDTCILIDILTHTPDTSPLHNSYHRQQPCGQGRRPEKWVAKRACISNPSPSFRHLHHSRQQHAAKLPTTTEQRWNSRYWGPGMRESASRTSGSWKMQDFDNVSSLLWRLCLLPSLRSYCLGRS